MLNKNKYFLIIILFYGTICLWEHFCSVNTVTLVISPLKDTYATISSIYIQTYTYTVF